MKDGTFSVTSQPVAPAAMEIRRIETVPTSNWAPGPGPMPSSYCVPQPPLHAPAMPSSMTPGTHPVMPMPSTTSYPQLPPAPPPPAGYNRQW